ncbi:MAG TPA: OstA-like protein [Saprospiraceae bacterium]|nr:OstA-like protein [Saprospiraceae bacterium]
MSKQFAGIIVMCGMMKKLFIFIILITFVHGAWAQQVEEKADTSKAIIINNADRRVFETIGDSLTNYLYGNVQAYHDSAFMYCDTAIQRGQVFRALGNVVILQSDTIRIFSDSLLYNADSSKAYLTGNVILENGLSKLYTQKLIYLTDKKIAYYYEIGMLENGESKLLSQQGFYDLNSKNAYFYHNVSVENPDFSLDADSLQYNTEFDKAYFLGPTLIRQPKSEIYCEKGYYDVKNKQARFLQNVQYKGEEDSAESDEIYHDGNQNLIKLIGHAHYEKEDILATADSIFNFRDTGEIHLLGNAYYHSSDRTMKGNIIKYNQNSGQILSDGRSTVTDKNSEITSDNLDYNGNSGEGIATGDVIVRDTLNNSEVWCDSLLLKKIDSLNTTTALGGKLKPMFLSINEEGDTMRLTGNILYTYQELYQKDSITTDTINYLLVDGDVKIFSSDFQAVSDSLIYNDRDSIFRMYKEPIIWSDSTQIFGDTCLIFLQNEEVNKMHFLSNAMIVNTTDFIFYNQIMGRRIFADFDDNKIVTMNVEGNARAIYYMQDKSKAYIGVKKSECSSILFNFENNDIKKIRFFTQPESKALPMIGTDHEALKLEGFKWYGTKRPVLLSLRDWRSDL